MEQTDILYQIASRIDDRTLLSLFPIFRTQIRKLVDIDDFWYVRSERLINQKLTHRVANWSRIYYALEKETSRIESRIRSDQQAVTGTVDFQFGLDYLPSLLTLEEVYLPPRWKIPERERKVISLISSPEVLQYVLEKGWLQKDSKFFNVGLVAAARKGWKQMIEPYYLCIKVDSPEFAVGALLDACMIAIENGRGEICDLLIDLLLRYPSDMYSDEMLDLLEAASSTRSKQIVTSVLRIYQGNDLEELREGGLEYTEYMATVEAIEAFVDAGIVDVQYVKERYSNALQKGYPGVVQFIINRGLQPEPKWDRLLKESMTKKYSLAYVTYLLTKAKPSMDLLELAMENKYPKEPLIALLLDPRIHIEDISIDLALDIYESIRYALIFELLEAERLNSMNAATKALRMEVHLKDVRSFIARCNLFSLVFRFMIFKLPSNAQLLDWMIETRDPKFQLAADAVASGEWDMDPELIPIEALMYSIVYPTLSPGELLLQMEELGIDEDLMFRSLALCGFQLESRSQEEEREKSQR